MENATVVRDKVNILAKELRNYALSDSEALKQQDYTKINQARDSDTKALLNLEKMTSNAQEILIINHLKVTGSEYLTFQKDVIKKVNEGNIIEASKMLTRDGQKYQQNLFNLIDDLVNLNKLSMQKAVQSSSLIYHNSLLYLLTFAILFFILGTILTLAITKQITRGLDRVSNVTEGFSSGGYGLGTRLEVGSRDEIGVVSKAFNKMADSLELQSSREKALTLELEESAWLSGNISKIFASLQEIDDLNDAAAATLFEIMPLLGASFSVIYVKMEKDNTPWLEKVASYGTNELEFEKQKK